MAASARIEPLEPDWATSGETLLAWARSRQCSVAKPRGGGLRFAFYGRVSTEDHQDPETSWARQRAQASALVGGYGRIVAEFFDVGQSRVLPSARRPEAAALVAAMADPDREFDAIVVGEYERAFYGYPNPVLAGSSRSCSAGWRFHTCRPV
ncbi:hypothetical protein [Actinoallomurus sp. CA-150999]|uniref:hypothetical protein n=1 Tax=Actinoallomurus sp. CA-150999 TaxID=3239887 RepID=UPI003D8D0560